MVRSWDSGYFWGQIITGREGVRGFWSSISGDTLFLDQVLVTRVGPLCENRARDAS